MKRIKSVVAFMFCFILVLSGCSRRPVAKVEAGQAEKDELSGTEWEATDDGSDWIFNEDHTFYWYMDKEEPDDNYYGGTYTLYKGMDAINFISEDLSSYSVSKKELLDVIERVEEYELDNFLCLYAENTTFMLDGEEQLSGKEYVPYFGFFMLDGEALDIANMKTGTYYGFTKVK